MMKKLKLLCFVLGNMLSIGCHTIVLENDKVKSEPALAPEGKWHHTGIFGLVNYSSNVYDVDDLCGDKTWKTMTTRRSAANIGAAVGVTIAADITLRAVGADIFNPVGIFWDPLYLEWSCVNGKRKD